MHSPGDVIGPYRLIRKLGDGAFGTVWLADKTTTIITTQVALKLPNHPGIDAESIRREAELWSLASGHPNILPILDAGIYNGQVCIDSQYAPHGTLSKWISDKGGKVSAATATMIATGILNGLEHLKSKNLVHRDLKPSNILMSGDTPQITDFGLARVLNDPSTSNIAAGTPTYMAPEAFDGDRTVEGDLWATGVILYEMITGKLPFYDSNVPKLRQMITLGQYESLPNSVPANVAAAIRGALEVDLARRFHSAEEMLATLEGRPVRVKSVTSKSNVNGPILVDLLMALTRELQRGNVENRKRTAERIGGLERDAILLIPLLEKRLKIEKSAVVIEAIKHALHRIDAP